MLKKLQRELPKIWTDELYSGQFRSYPAAYRDFDHTLKHILKATVKLVELTEEADHHVELEYLHPDSVEKYIADIVISAVRLALVNPRGPVDVEKAVIERIRTKMGVDLNER